MCGPDSEKIILASHKEFVSIKEIDDQFGTKYYVAISPEGTEHKVQAEVTCYLWKATGLTIMNID